MKKLIRTTVAASLVAISTAAYAFPGGEPGNIPYSGLCTMGNPDGSGQYFLRIPCWAQAVLNHPVG